MTLTSANLDILPRSLAAAGDIEYALAHVESQIMLVILAPNSGDLLSDFEAERHPFAENQVLLVGPCTTHNAAALRSRLSFLQPILLGLKTSAGMGDRIGLATPGHVRAARAVGGIAPIFAQQSIREMARTGRSPQQVMDDATWGMFAEGWQDGAGADADHQKTTDDLDACLAAGFTFFTIDPGAYVDNRAETAPPGVLRELAEQLPKEMNPHTIGLKGRYFRFEGLSIQFDETTLLKAAVKYGKAVHHVAHMYHHLASAAGVRPFELEVSVDETDQPTSHAEHIYIASELRRLGVQWVSLAPRYQGTFEKGVDYIGEVNLFDADIAGHAAVARHFGPYKLSLHSGSDKFSIYPAAMRRTQGLVHLKTAGTSYLEALRTAADIDPALLEDIYAFAFDRYETDRQSYHVSARLDRAPKPGSGEDLTTLLDQFDAREILHVTFGSVLTERLPDGELRFYHRLISLLKSNPECYAQNLEKHFIRHLKPFHPAAPIADRVNPAHGRGS